MLYNASSRARNAVQTGNQPIQKPVGDMPTRVGVNSWGAIYRKGKVYNSSKFWLTRRAPKASPLAGLRFTQAMGVDHY